MIPTRNYFRIMLGSKSRYADVCREGSFIGGDFEMDMDLTGNLPEDWREFNQQFIPIYLEKRPDKVESGSRIGLRHAAHHLQRHQNR